MCKQTVINKFHARRRFAWNCGVGACRPSIMNRLCEKCREEFRDKGNVDHMLESSVKRNHPKCVDLFIAAGANVNSYHKPVRICCEEGYDKCLKLLVEAGARVNQQY